MIFDVETAERSAFDRDFDVCIIGAGPAGITLARRLAARGFDVALLEGGGLQWSEESQDVAVGESVGLAYPDLDVARVRCFGGSSGHWNGLCRAFEAADMRPRPQNPLSGWPIGRADLDPYQAEVAEILDLVPDGGDVPPAVPVPPEDGFHQVWYLRSAPTRFGEKYLDEIRAAERIALGIMRTSSTSARRQPDPRRRARSSAVTPPTIPASPSGRAATASAPAASRTRGFCSTSPASSRPASATRTIWWADISVTT